MKKIGIVTITFNSANVIVPFLDCMLHQTHTNFILYIIDNISSDQTLDIIKQFDDPRMVVIANTTNVGVAAGNNQGIKKALEDNCDEILIINNDIECEYTLLEKLSAQLDLLPCSLIAPKMMYYPETNLIWWAGTKFKERNGCMTDHIGIQEVDKGQYDKIETMDYAPTCCVLMKKKVIEDTGIMDEKYFAYYDDTDFFYRIYKQGIHRLMYYPFVKFYHKVGGLSNMKEGNARKFKFNNFYIHLFTRNHVYYLKKHRDFWGWANILYFYFYLNLRYFFSGKYHRTLATFRLLQRSYFEGLLMK
jgi:GT2 family glycosyltransferase